MPYGFRRKMSSKGKSKFWANWLLLNYERNDVVSKIEVNSKFWFTNTVLVVFFFFLILI